MSEDETLDEFVSTKGEVSEKTEQPELIQGVAWSNINSIPEEWNLNNIESDIDILSGNNFSSDHFVEEGGTPLIRIRDLAEDETTENFDGEYDSRYLINQQDLLVGMDGEFEPHLWAGPQALLNQRVCKIEPNNTYNKIFFRYAIEKPLFYIQKSIAGTTVKHLSKSNINDINLPTPPLSEQRKIATVLYTVHRAIEKTENIIRQTKKVRNGLRQSAFKFGVDETGEFRDLDDDMLQETRIGNIPKSWDFLRLDEVCSDVVDCLNTTPEYSDSGIRVVLTSEIEDGRYDPESSPYVSEEVYEERIRRIAPQPGDVIFTREAPIGEAFKIPKGERLCLGQRTMQLRPRGDSLDSDFLLELLYSEKMQSWFQRVAVGSTTKHMRVGDVEGMKIPVPNLREQRRIASLLGSYRDYIETNLRYSDQLKRLKRGLMQDLLSGTIRTTDTNIEVPEQIAQYG